MNGQKNRAVQLDYGEWRGYKEGASGVLSLYRKERKDWESRKLSCYVGSETRETWGLDPHSSVLK